MKKSNIIIAGGIGGESCRTRAERVGLWLVQFRNRHRHPSSVIFGALYQSFGPLVAFGWGAALAVIAAILLMGVAAKPIAQSPRPAASPTAVKLFESFIQSSSTRNAFCAVCSAERNHRGASRDSSRADATASGSARASGTRRTLAERSAAATGAQARDANGTPRTLS